MSEVTALLIAVAVLIGNAFFVAAEFALISARRTQIEPRALAGSRSARTTLKAMEHVTLMMAGAQLGITICSLILGAVGEPAFAHLLEAPFLALGLPPGLVHPVAFVLALVVVVALHMVLGEMVPKNISLASPEDSALTVGPMLYWLVVALRPIIWLLNKSANLILRIFGIHPKDEVTAAFTREEVADFVHESRREGLIDDYEHNLVVGALGFAATPTSDVALPLRELITVDAATSAAQLERLTVETGYSRFPMRGMDGRSLVGYVHAKDALAIPADRADQPLPAELIRPLVTVTRDSSLRDALGTMQAAGAHLARVADDDAAVTMGLVTLEDVVEKLVGEIRDATTPRGR